MTEERIDEIQENIENGEETPMDLAEVLEIMNGADEEGDPKSALSITLSTVTETGKVETVKQENYPTAVSELFFREDLAELRVSFRPSQFASAGMDYKALLRMMEKYDHLSNGIYDGEQETDGPDAAVCIATFVLSPLELMGSAAFVAQNPVLWTDDGKQDQMRKGSVLAGNIIKICEALEIRETGLPGISELKEQAENLEVLFSDIDSRKTFTIHFLFEPAMYRFSTFENVNITEERTRLLSELKKELLEERALQEIQERREMEIKTEAENSLTVSEGEDA